MRKNFSLFEQLDVNLKTIDDIDNCIKITLGPTGKNGISYSQKDELKLITSGSLLIQALDFPTSAGNVILKLLEQASIKSYKISGDGSTTTILLACQLLKSALKFLVNGYNSIFISNGLKKIAYFLVEKVLEFSIPISNVDQLVGVLKTSIGKKLNPELIDLLNTSISKIGKDGVILVEQNVSEANEIDIVQGIELDKGFASSYFVNDLKNFEVVYDNPYLLITKTPINSINQIREVIEYIKLNNRPLIIIAEQINKEIVSTLVLNNMQKKFKVAVIKYTSIQFLKTGILEDLSVLTHANYFQSNVKNKNEKLTVNDLGQAQKVIIKKDKSTFIVSKFAKIIAKRRINELNRQLITSETDYEKSLYKTRIARLSGNITKLKVGLSNQYQIEEERQKVENAIITVRAALEEGIVPGGGMFYLYLQQELKNWSYLNLIGEEIFSAQIVTDALLRPFHELFSNTNTSRYQISEKLSVLGYPYGYNLVNQKVVHTLEEGLVDSAKSVRAILWNSITIICTMIVSE
jgi:chaperonin GroEL|tara:strand:+ start:2277 stop:3839 length:1563 start_codon:yes stop_codon:yes gene_type:complete